MSASKRPSKLVAYACTNPNSLLISTVDRTNLDGKCHLQGMCGSVTFVSRVSSHRFSFTVIVYSSFSATFTTAVGSTFTVITVVTQKPTLAIDVHHCLNAQPIPAFRVTTTTTTTSHQLKNKKGPLKKIPVVHKFVRK